jgi:catechol 2,3-dioxygenase-like lactoylglutathione lyase family enzyme
MSVATSGSLHHICFVVHDVERTARSLEDALGIQWNLWTIEVPTATIRGREESFTFRVALGGIGGAYYELIEPVSDNSVYVEHLAEKGEGFHHTGIAYQTQEAVEEARAELLSQGRELIQGGTVDGAFAFYYFDVPELGGALELLWLAALPDPEMTIG